MKNSLSIIAVIVSLSLVAQPKPLNMNKRETTQQQAEYFIPSNESGSRYILDIFNSLSNNSISDPITSQANTIRSLKNVAPGNEKLSSSIYAISSLQHARFIIAGDFFVP